MAPTTTAADLALQYRQNFARHILSITLYMQAEVMKVLKPRHSQLRINFEPYISAAAERGARLSDIARMLGISRQAANQTARQLIDAGYLKRAADPSDGRASLLVTTPLAKALVTQGASEAMTIYARFADIAGKDVLEQANNSAIVLSKNLSLLFPYEDASNIILPGVLPRLSEYVRDRLQSLTSAKGHPRLKRSFGTVLTAIGPRGGRIQQMANRHDVSKQAIGAIAAELQEIGYIRHDPDPTDARHVVLHFTTSGRKLIADSVASIAELEAEFAAIIGVTAVEQLKDTMLRIYQSLHLEDDIFEPTATRDIHILARQLNQQLGEEGAKALARLILSSDFS